MKPKALFPMLLIVASTLRADGLSPLEQRLAASIAEREPEAIGLLEKLVGINSGSLSFEGVREIGRIFSGELEKLGFEVRWEDGSAYGRAGHLLARRPGDGMGVLLIGHLDTVFEADSPFQHAEWVGEHELRGPGVTDMKGGDVVLLEALRALDREGLLDRLDLRVVLTGDEEKAGHPLEESRKSLRELAEGAEVALGFEDGDGDPRTAVISRRGSSDWTLEVAGRSAHSSQIFSDAVGDGAVYETARILTAFREVLADEENLTYNPGFVVAGTDIDFDLAQSRGAAFGKRNVVAQKALVDGDLRALSPEQLARARSKMREVVAASLPGTSATITFADGYPPMAPSEDNRRLLALYDRASRDLGLGEVLPVHPLNAGAADVSFIAETVPMVLDGLGLMGRHGHTVDETADMRTLVSQAQRTAVLLARLALAER